MRLRRKLCWSGRANGYSKTGAVLRDRGGRDEHGMQPLDDIFSSPRDGATTVDIDDDDDGSGDMEIASSAYNCCDARAQERRSS